jgi:CRISPR/Cas system CSM-associated protein Csm3 (group 7 of RAMP superfamily)
MSRVVLRRWHLTGDLVALSPIHVGGLGDGPPHLVVARDGLDRPVIPGTSLAGVIQAALGPVPEQEARLWDPAAGRDEQNRDDGTGEASRVSVDDALAPAATPVQTRDHVAIDRIHGAAADGRLYAREVLPAGTRFAFRLVVDDAGGPEAEAMIGRTAALLRGPGVQVGAAVTRGLGRVRLEDAALVRYDLGTRAGMMAALTEKGIAVDLPAAEVDALARRTLRVTIPWRPRGPLAVHVSADGDVVDAFPLTTVHNGARRLELPGSTIKGVLRSHAERILRTITHSDAPTDFLDQMSVDRLGPVAALFGTAADRDHDQPTGRRGALRVANCLGQTELPATQWQQVCLLQRQAGENVSGDGDADSEALARLQRAVESLNAATDGVRFVIAPHVAIDRWTGGAAIGRLFATLEPHSTDANTWHPIILDLDVGWLAPEPTGEAVASPGYGGLESALAVLLLVLRDLCDGWIGFGHATTRGMGAVEVDPSAVTFRTSPDLDRLGCIGDRYLVDVLDGRSLADILDDDHVTTRLMAALCPTAPVGSNR